VVAESRSLPFRAPGAAAGGATAPAARAIEVYRYGPPALALIGAVVALLGIPFAAALEKLWSFWTELPEYSHGPLLPLIAAFLIWQRKDLLERMELRGSWWGPPAVALAGAMYVVGAIGAVTQLQQYALVVALLGVALSLTGGAAFGTLIGPLLILLLMIPLPMFVLNNLSAELQLLSSALGVGVIRAFGISVFRDGNVIDLGGYRLQVIEACDGLRYLFPLMVLAFLIAYFYRGALWKRVAIVIASAPLTVAMNSLRIGTIGIMVEHWGVGMAEGFLHEFQGWMVFMLSAALLVGFGMALNGIGREAGGWRQLFGLEFPAPTPPGARRLRRRLPMPFQAGAAMIVAIAAVALLLPARAEVTVARRAFAGFPTHLGRWTGHPQPLEPQMLAVLQLSDYILSDYVAADGRAANFYVSYYDSQRDRAVVHSPRACIPGGGWNIEERAPIALRGTGLRVNRMIIANGDRRQLVYYWFDQRGRNLTDEYAVKWYLFWDAARRRRTDGAMVRLMTPIYRDELVARADARLTELGAAAAGLLPAYIPH
jgi:exosortase D (VPLPA-CTERM-specific)